MAEAPFGAARWIAVGERTLADRVLWLLQARPPGEGMSAQELVHVLALCGVQVTEAEVVAALEELEIAVRAMRQDEAPATRRAELLRLREENARLRATIAALCEGRP